MTTAAIFGCRGLTLTPWEKRFFADVSPWGLILFRRNCQTPDQIRRLTASFREAVGQTNAPVLIDQEGGRVRRLIPPAWHDAPSAKRLGDLWRRSPESGKEAVRLNYQIIASELTELGITVNCAPVMDVPVPGSHSVVGDRAFSDCADEVALLGRIVCEAHLVQGVLPILKHMPGHGRATADSHRSLPVVKATREQLKDADFKPFAELNDMPAAITAHIVFPDWDDREPATTSKVLIRDVIRGNIGFDGLLLTDDVSMRALKGPLRERVEKSLSAGCDMILHCNGKRGEMRKVAESVPNLTAKSQQRARLALARPATSRDFDPMSAKRQLAHLLEMGEGEGLQA